ncbi:MAG TPA: Xaa-Pro peptidase family protein, partial [Bryobacteraceae bacterium]|nr:Xaa-Pro peptidase family protein [Bryobacteraceae bacterium]
LDRSGDLRALVTDPWDCETISAPLDGQVSFTADLEQGLQELAGASGKPAIAVAGMELMEERFVQALPGAVSATAAVEELRRVKIPEEIELLKQAAELADRGYQHFAQTVETGMAEYELVAETEAFLKASGAEDNFMLIASGGTEVTGMKPPTERRFQLGDSVTTELTPALDGYYAQICRTLVLGEPNDRQREAFGIFAEAQKAGQDILKPGVDVADVARAQNDVFRKYGYGEYTGPKYTRVRGHNLGLHPDEHPYILEDVHYTIKEDMVLIAHPNTYLPLSGYMVFGDSLLVTRDGCVPLNRTERKLFQK